jgi:hypothetical protein
MEETRAVGRLPHLDVEIVRRSLPEQEVEQLTISLRASPSFDAFGRYLDAQLLLWPWLALNPLVLWQRMLRQAWQPWLVSTPGEPARAVAGPQRPPPEGAPEPGFVSLRSKGASGPL